MHKICFTFLSFVQDHTQYMVCSDKLFVIGNQTTKSLIYKWYYGLLEWYKNKKNKNNSFFLCTILSFLIFYSRTAFAQFLLMFSFEFCPLQTQDVRTANVSR